MSTDLDEALRRYLVRVEADDSIEITDVVEPTVRGLSNLTVYFSLHRSGRDTAESLVLKREPTGGFAHALPVASQGRLLTRLGAMSALPLPRALWWEDSSDDLGSAFMIMERVAGAVPPSAPSMHAAGHFVALSPRDRRTAYEAGIRCLAALHRIDPADRGLADILGRAPTGVDSFRAGVAALRRQYDELPDQHAGVMDRAFDWLTGCDLDESPVVVCWGDARPGNLVYDGTTVAAVLDWEMACLGSPESDVAWWLSLDEFQSTGMGTPRLEGLPAAEEQVALYADLTGRVLRDLTVHQVHAALRMAVISLELERLYVAAQGAGQRPGRGLALRHLERQLVRAGA